MWAESILPFLEADFACDKLVVGREMCLRELTVRKLPESLLAGRHVKPGHCGLCSRSQSEQEPPAWPGCEPDLHVWAFSMCCCLWHLTRRPHTCHRVWEPRDFQGLGQHGTLFSLVVPFLPLGPHVAYSMVFGLFASSRQSQVPTLSCPYHRSPLGLPLAVVQRDPSSVGVTGRIPCAP